MISISKFGLTKEQALCALYRHAGCFNMGALSFRSGDLDLKEAKALLETQTYFDYLYGRVMKVNLKDDSFDERLYDRDNGRGEAEWALLDYATSPNTTIQV